MPPMISSTPLARPLGVGLLLLLGGLVTASCGGSGTPPPETFLLSSVGPPPSPTMSMCNLNEPGAPFVDTGTAAQPSQNGGPFQVVCSVSQSGSSFQVALSAVTPSGSINISGTMSNDPSTPQPNITAAFDSMSNSYSAGGTGDQACTVSFVTGAQATLDGYSGNKAMGVFPGRIWGILTCPNMKQFGGTSVCYGSAEFLFQYCDE